MLSGKAVARALRGHLLIESALHNLLTESVIRSSQFTDPGEKNEVNDSEIV